MLPGQASGIFAQLSLNTDGAHTKKRHMGLALAGLALALGTAVQAPAAAQDTSPWMPFIGCWEGEAASRRDPITCLLPVDGDPLAADLVVLQDGKELRRSQLRADGTVSAFEAAECRGRESSRFSLDATRVYLHGEVACGSDDATRTVSLLSISPEARLIQVSGRGAEDDTKVTFRVLRGVPWARLPKAVRGDLDHLEAAVFAQRTAASRMALSTSAVVETSRSVGAPVSEIWLAALEDPFLNSIMLSENGARVVSGAQLEMQRTIIRLAQATSGATGQVGPSGGGRVASSSVCGGLVGMYATGGGLGAIGIVSAQGARQLLMAGCQNIVANDPRVFENAYGAYAGALEWHEASTRRPPPVGHPAPEPLLLNGLGTGRSGGQPSAGVRRPAPRPPGARDSPPATTGHPAPDPIPLGGLGTGSSSGTPGSVRTP